MPAQHLPPDRHFPHNTQAADTSQRITAPSGTEWMNQDRAFHRWLHPDAVVVEPDPRVRLMSRRRAYLDQRIAELRARGRTPRVCLYVVAEDVEAVTGRVEVVRSFAVQEGWLVGAEQVFVDRSAAADPAVRPGWAEVQRQVRSGFADGVVAWEQLAITLDLREYEAQLRWFAEHFAFIALVRPEVAARLR